MMTIGCKQIHSPPQGLHMRIARLLHILIRKRPHHVQPDHCVVGGALWGDPQEGQLLLVVGLAGGVEGVAHDVHGLRNLGGDLGLDGAGHELHDVRVFLEHQCVREVVDELARLGGAHLEQPVPAVQHAVDPSAVNKRVDVALRGPLEEVHDCV